MKSSATGQASTTAGTAGSTATTPNATTSTGAKVDANTNVGTNANANTNANTNTNVNANQNLNANTNSNTNVNANTNLNATNNVNADTQINAQTATRVISALGLNLAQNAGAGLTVSNLGQNAVFSQVGIRPGDQIVSIGGRNIASPVEFARYLYTVQPGQRIPVIVTRNGAQQTLYWTPNQTFLTALPQQYRVGYAPVAPAAPQGILGVRLDETQQQRVIVADVVPASPAGQAGVRPGDQITAVNRQPVQSPDDFRNSVAQIPADQPVQLSLQRADEVNVSAFRPVTVEMINRVAAPIPEVPVVPVAPGVVTPRGAVVPAVPGGPVRRLIRNR